MKKIDLFIIGTQKAGTTAIIRYLSQHPLMTGHQSMEYPYFLDNEFSDSGYLKSLKKFYGKSTFENNIKLLAKNVNVMYSESALRQIYNYNADIKLLIILRNPVDRAFSSFQHALSRGYETIENFQEAIYSSDTSRFGNNRIAKRSCQYLEYGKYAKYLKHVYDVFPKENVRVYFYEEMFSDITKYLEEFQSLLGLTESFAYDVSQKVNKTQAYKNKFLARLFQPGGYTTYLGFLPENLKRKIKKRIFKRIRKPVEPKKLQSEDRKALEKYYQESNNELYQLLGRGREIWERPIKNVIEHQ